jgi:cell wall-associated NlpC family hydrolase
LAGGAQAAPEHSSSLTDPVMALLAERKLLKPLDGSQVMQTMRDKASEAVMSAMNFLGVPYRRGGNTEATGFDCSGFTRHIFENSLGLVLPRRADEQASLSSLLPIQRHDLKPGDLVFFNTMKRTFSHVGIYVGDDKFIHSPRAGGAVRIEDMRESYWARRFTGARRADLGAATPSPR